MAASAIGVAKQVLRGLRVADARRIASRSLLAKTPSDVEKVLTEFMTPQERR
jgi:signal transduction protein with GAF and PtsI domain